MIFKTIESSVDSSRQTLALFNKDWNTYKRNWQNANGIGGKIGSVFTPANAITKSDVDAIKAYNAQIDSCVTSQTAFNRTMLNASPAAQNLVASYNGGKVSAQGLTTAQNAAKVSTIGLTVAQTALNVAIGMGVGLLINLVVQGVNKLIHANEEAIESAKKLREEYEEFKSTNASNVSTLKGLEEEFKELSKGVSQYGDNISLTTEQYERYKEIIQQIVGMSPSLAEGYDTENGYIADKNGLLERAIELQEIEYRNELRKITNLENLKTSMSGYIAEYKEAFEGGFVTDDMSATSTIKSTDFSNALYQAFNVNDRADYDSEDLAREILKSLGVDDVDKEMEKFFNENGYYQPNWFYDEYVDEIANNINTVTDALSFETVGLDEDEFENRILTVKDCAQAYLDMKDSISMANESIQTDLRYIAEYADGYDSLSSEQQKFVNEFLKGFNIDDITSRDWFGNLTYDEDKMKSVKRQINDFVEALSQDETIKDALADLYAIPTDEQSISEFVAQFRSALEIIKAYCEENGIEIPISITNSEEAINELEAQQQRAVDFAKDKFDGYDPTAFFKENSINTQEEVDKWLEIAQAANSAADAEERYVQGLTLDNEIDVSFAEQMQEIHSLSEGLDQLDTIMADVIDSETFDYSSILDPEGDFATTFSGFTEEYDALIESITNSPTDLAKSQKAFNDLATAYIVSKDALSKLTEETKNAAVLDLKQMGVKNAEEVVDAYLELNKAKEEVISLGYDFSNITEEEALQLQKIWTASDIAKKGLVLYEIQKAQVNNNPIDTIAECNQLYNLATAAGYTGSALLYLTKIQTLLNKISVDKLVEGTLGYESVMGQITQYNGLLQQVTNSEMKATGVVVDFGDGAKSAAAAQEKLADATDKATEALEAQKSALEDQKQYYDDVAEAITWFYDKQINKTESLIDNLEKENELLQEQLDGYDSALSAIDRFYEKEIDAIQSKIDAMDEANEAAEREIALEKAKEALLAARNNRTVMQYQKGVGFVYTTDEAAIKEAENNLADAEQEKAKADLQAEIDKLEHYRELWADIPNIKQKAEEDSMMIQLLGAEWESILLSGRLENITAFKNQYVALQSEIDSNERLIASYEEKIAYYEALKQEWDNLLSKYEEDTYIQLLITEFGKDYESELLNGRTLSWQQFADNYSHIKDELNRVTDEIDAIAKRAEEYAARISQAASGAKKELDSLADSPLPKNTPYEYKSSQDHARVNGYAIGFSTGGIVSENSRSNLDYLAKANGEDHTVFVKEGEAIISKKTVDANQKIIGQLLAAQGREINPNIPIQNTIYFKRMKEIGFTPQFSFLHSSLGSFTAPENTPGTILQFYGDLSFPNVHSGNDAQMLIQELSTLSQKAEQHVRKRK